MKLIGKISVFVLAFSTACISFENTVRLAEDSSEMFNFEDALLYYRRAWEMKNNPDLANSLALIYLKRREFREAEYWFNLYAGSAKLTVEDLYAYSEILIGTAKFPEAKGCLDKIAELDKSEAEKPKWKVLFKSAIEAKDLLNSISEFELAPFKEVNTEFADFGYTAFGKEKYFISDRKDPLRKSAQNKTYTWTGNDFLKVYSGNYHDSTKFLINLELAEGFRSRYHVGPIFISKEFEFITINPDKKSYKLSRKAEINTILPNIYIRKKDDKGLGVNESEKLLGEIGIDAAFSDPFWDETRKRLFFAADLPNGMGRSDIYYMDYLGEGNWSGPFNLGSKINTFGNERSPFLYSDTLYFASDGLGGLGGLDIYKVYFKDGIAEKPVNMGVPFNSNKDDFFYYIDKWQDDLQVLSSDRDGGMGKDDIYYLRKIGNDYTDVVLKFIDFDTNNFLKDVSVEITNNNTRVQTFLVSDDEGIAVARFPNSAVSLDISAFKSEYLNNVLDNVKVSHGDTLLILMEKLRLNKPVVIEDILYDFDDYSILPESAIKLQRLVKILEDNPYLVAVLRAHTDSRGSYAYNQKLSEKRGKSAFDYLVKSGIAPSRLSYTGMGKSLPLIDCGEICSESEHSLNRRTEFVLFYRSNLQAKPILYESYMSEPANNESVKEEPKISKKTLPTSEMTLSKNNIVVLNEEQRGYYYHIIESFSNKEAALQVAEDYQNTTKVVYIIPPFDEKSYFRVAIDRYETFEQANKQLNGVREKYRNSAIWLLQF